MRLWSFHPKYLDNIGLSRAINEAISGYKALTGQQKMWKNHSQLIRFNNIDGLTEIKEYIEILLKESYNRKIAKIKSHNSHRLPVIFSEWKKVTEGQLKYEWQHYLNKLKTQKGRDKQLYDKFKNIELPESHPLFKVVPGDIESWEKVK